MHDKTGGVCTGWKRKDYTIDGCLHWLVGTSPANSFYPTLAPPGKTVLKVQFNTNYDYWKQLSQEPERYNAEKEQIAHQVVVLLDQRFPGRAAQVEMHNVATPTTWERYTGNWRGSYEVWLPSLGAFMNRISKILSCRDLTASIWLGNGLSRVVACPRPPCLAAM